MTEQTQTQEVVSYEAECLEIKTQLDTLGEKFKEHFEKYIKPVLPEFLIAQIEKAVIEMEAKNALVQKAFDYTDLATLEGHKEALKTMQALTSIYGIKA